MKMPKYPFCSLVSEIIISFLDSVEDCTSFLFVSSQTENILSKVGFVNIYFARRIIENILSRKKKETSTSILLLKKMVAVDKIFLDMISKLKIENLEYEEFVSLKKNRDLGYEFFNLRNREAKRYQDCFFQTGKKGLCFIKYKVFDFENPLIYGSHVCFNTDLLEIFQEDNIEMFKIISQKYIDVQKNVGFEIFDTYQILPIISSTLKNDNISIFKYLCNEFIPKITKRNLHQTTEKFKGFLFSPLFKNGSIKIIKYLFREKIISFSEIENNYLYLSIANEKTKVIKYFLKYVTENRVLKKISKKVMTKYLFPETKDLSSMNEWKDIFDEVKKKKRSISIFSEYHFLNEIMRDRVLQFSTVKKKTKLLTAYQSMRKAIKNFDSFTADEIARKSNLFQGSNYRSIYHLLKNRTFFDKYPNILDLLSSSVYFSGLYKNKKLLYHFYSFIGRKKIKSLSIFSYEEVFSYIVENIPDIYFIKKVVVVDEISYALFKIVVEKGFKDIIEFFSEKKITKVPLDDFISGVFFDKIINPVIEKKYFKAVYNIITNKGIDEENSSPLFLKVFISISDVISTNTKIYEENSKIVNSILNKCWENIHSDEKKILLEKFIKGGLLLLLKIISPEILPEHSKKINKGNDEFLGYSLSGELCNILH